ncbi:cysteine synthase A [Sutterella sp.]|uniref:cysteine synthase A n=1 Tax=Sutterella sp. TaxID=1981025 RepID=UPI0026E0E450|nr:cysteine synthase A [Sutterella sp.]MDO5530373.1 cysteine synthase A [Sutterella sp.]
MTKASSVLELIGNTPVVRLSRLFPDNEVWLKLERTNPGGSVKDRIALQMILDAQASGALKAGGTIIEPTSGNTGVGLAMVSAVLGYRMILVMPESMSIERRLLAQAYGAELVLTPASAGMKGAVDRANELAKEIPGAWVAGQFSNPSNPKVHELRTGPEIVADFPHGLDVFVSAFGTGGNVSGISRVLKKAWPTLRSYGVEPASSPLLTEGRAGPHRIQGIGANFVPDNLDRSAVDQFLDIKDDDAFRYAQLAARKEGLLVGISTGAVLAAVAGLIETLPKDSRILALNFDTGERYLSVKGFVAENN